MRIKPVRAYLPPELKRAALAYAKEQDRSVSNLIVHALGAYLSKCHKWKQKADVVE